jgi:hypothetical protein
MTISVAVCAHASRVKMAMRLADKLGAPISMDSDGDNAHVGIISNHDSALRLAARWDADWDVVIEDDAEPIPGFCEQASAALATIPEPVASLYLGWVGKPRRRITFTLDRVDPCWVLRPGFTSAVCIAVRKTFVEPLLEEAETIEGMTVDERYSAAARQLGYQWVPHSNPSLVEHSDVPGVDGDCGIPRHAYRVGARDEWTGRSTRFWEKIWN